MKKASIAIVIALICAFLLILWAACRVGDAFGQRGEVAALTVIAIILFIGYQKTKGDQ